MLIVNICIHNQPSKHFAKEDQKVVVALMCGQCTKHGLLRRGIMRAWFIRYIKDEAPMLVIGILSYEFQSQYLTKFMAHESSILRDLS
jgi:hypothetical protein